MMHATYSISQRAQNKCSGRLYNCELLGLQATGPITVFNFHCIIEEYRAHEFCRINSTRNKMHCRGDPQWKFYIFIIIHVIEVFSDNQG